MAELVRRREPAAKPWDRTRAYEQVDRFPAKWLKRAASFLSSPAVAEELRAIVTSEQPDVVLIDSMFPAALSEAMHFACPTVVMVHTAVLRMLPLWREQLAMIVSLRTEAGFPQLPADLDTLWMQRDLVLVSTLKSLDAGPAELLHAEKLRHVGPILEMERHGARVPLPWSDDDPTPLVVVSFSTAPEQGSSAKFQHAIDALAGLPVHGVITVGDSVDPATLTPADNVVIFATADHDDLMRRAALVVTHGGHGTLMRALRQGLPTVIVPGMAHDQTPNAIAAQGWGAGRALARDANAETMREAMHDVLTDPTYRSNAMAISHQLASVDGATNAATEIEGLLRA